MSRLIVISNRVALPDETAPGGLASGLRAALREQGGIWFGWSGEISDNRALSHRQDGPIEFMLADLTIEEHEPYYLGFSNRTLWPLFHYRPSLLDYSRHDFMGYWAVNERFARLLALHIRPDDMVWVHDYHLIPLARELRALGVTARIGFFLHVPLPPASLLALLPHHELLFPSWIDYDMVGLQTAADAASLRGYLLRYAHAKSYGAGPLRGPDGTACDIGVFPIGIDAETIASQAAHAMELDEVRKLDVSLQGRHLMIGVDRLDYSKGLPHRFEAFGRFLNRHPQWRTRVSYLQIAPSSRGEVAEYQALQRKLEHLAGATNGRYADPDWVPIRYVNRSFPHEVLAGYYRLADIGLVTPLRDGMNLVAKEFVAAQLPEDPGVLILSCFAGAACELEGAIVINPIDPEDIVESIYQALTMSIRERRARWRDLFTQVSHSTIDVWRTNFLKVLKAAAIRPPSADPYRQSQRIDQYG